ncbi:MAG: cellulase N-terminal Ig-like domain-containing protein [Sediminibacterium sp.]
MRLLAIPLLIVLTFSATAKMSADSSWIRINQLGYTTRAIKQAVWCSKGTNIPLYFELVHALTGRVVYRGKASSGYGAYGPFSSTARLGFSSWRKPGKYYLQAGNSRSPVFA